MIQMIWSALNVTRHLQSNLVTIVTWQLISASSSSGVKSVEKVIKTRTIIHSTWLDMKAEPSHVNCVPNDFPMRKHWKLAKLSTLGIILLSVAPA